MERMGVDRPDCTWHKSNLWAHHFRREFTPCLLIPSGLGRITSIPVSRRAHWSRSPVYSPGGFLDQNQLFGLRNFGKEWSQTHLKGKAANLQDKGSFFFWGGGHKTEKVVGFLHGIFYIWKTQKTWRFERKENLKQHPPNTNMTSWKIIGNISSNGSFFHCHLSFRWGISIVSSSYICDCYSRRNAQWTHDHIGKQWEHQQHLPSPLASSLNVHPDLILPIDRVVWHVTTAPI